MPHDLRFHIRACAEAIIARNMRLVALGIAIVCIALMDDPALSLAIGGSLNLAGCVLLLALARGAAQRDCRRTELWQVLRNHIEMPERTAQIVFGDILRACYARSARVAALAAALFLTMSALWYAGHHFADSAEASQRPGAMIPFPAGKDDGHGRH